MSFTVSTKYDPYSSTHLVQYRTSQAFSCCVFTSLMTQSQSPQSRTTHASLHTRAAEAQRHTPYEEAAREPERDMAAAAASVWTPEQEAYVPTATPPQKTFRRQPSKESSNSAIPRVIALWGGAGIAPLPRSSVLSLYSHARAVGHLRRGRFRMGKQSSPPPNPRAKTIYHTRYFPSSSFVVDG